jgi:hypothetical protein
MSASFSPWILGITSYGLRGDVSFLTGDWGGLVGWDLGWERTAWPRERGLMSRKASVFSVSRSLKQGISPRWWWLLVRKLRMELRGAQGARELGCLREVQKVDLPLMILQKMQAAILLVIVIVL